MVIRMDGDENGCVDHDRHEHKWTHIDTSFEAISMKVMMIVMVIMIMAVMMMVMMTMIMLVKTIIVTGRQLSQSYVAPVANAFTIICIVFCHL